MPCTIDSSFEFVDEESSGTWHDATHTSPVKSRGSFGWDVMVAFLDHNSDTVEPRSTHGKTVRTTVWQSNSKVLTVTVTFDTVTKELSPWPTSHPFSWPAPWLVRSFILEVCVFTQSGLPVDGRTLSVGV